MQTCIHNTSSHILHCFYRLILFFVLFTFQTQLSHGFPYADRRGDYSGSIGVNNPNRLHEHDPLALHQALQSAVDDGQNAGMDENAAFMSDLPLLKSELH